MKSLLLVLIGCGMWFGALGTGGTAENAELPPSQWASRADGEIQALALFKTIGEITSRLQQRPAAVRRAIYLAIAIERNFLPPSEADELLATLGAVEGFDRAAKQLCSGSQAGVNGALHELRLARAFSERGATVLELRKPFKGDPSKHQTDIDLLVEAPGGRRLAIETKSYGKVPLDIVGRDVATLVHYVDANPTVRATLSLIAEPAAALRKQLATKNVLLLIGPPADQAEAISQLTPVARPRDP